MHFSNYRLDLQWLWGKFTFCLRAIRFRTFHFVQKFRSFFRAVGLGIITIFYLDEQKKILVNKSRLTALARSAVHILPAAVSSYVISINLRSFFIGNELQGFQNEDSQKLAALQVAAKVQELLVVSSTAAVIFHILRYELLFGQGVPLGLLSSGWSFSEASYFWSAEFWGGVLYPNTLQSRWRRRFLIALLFFGCLLALLAGPATAVLMIPRVMDWPVGGAVYWLNGSDEQLWPKNLDSKYMSEYPCSCIEMQCAWDPRCPSAGYGALYQHFSSWWNFPDWSPLSFDLEDLNMRKAVYGISRNDEMADTWSFTTHAATATLQDAMQDLYVTSLWALKEIKPEEPPYPANLDLATTQSYKVKTKVPFVRVACNNDHIVVRLNETIRLRYPMLPEFAKFVEPREYLEIDTTEAVRSYAASKRLDIGNPAAIPPLLAIPLPLEGEPAASLGLAVFQQNNTNNSKFDAIACAIDARWAAAESVIQGGQMSRPLYHEFWNDRTRNSVQTSLDFISFRDMVAPSSVFPQDDGSVERINISPTWFDLLSPSIAPADIPSKYPLNAHLNRTMMESLLEIVLFYCKDCIGYDGYPDAIPLTVETMKTVEHLISVVFTDGLSRCGSHINLSASRFLGAWQMGSWTIADEDQARSMVHNGEPKETFSLPSILAHGNSTRFVMRAYFTGYVMTAQDSFDYLSIAILLLHILLALSHTAWVVFWGRTSESWDTIPELIALAQTSSPPLNHSLDNTCVGIRKLKTMGRVSWVEVQTTATQRHPSFQAREDLVLHVGEKPSEIRDPNRIAQAGMAYGRARGRITVSSTF